MLHIAWLIFVGVFSDFGFCSDKDFHFGERVLNSNSTASIGTYTCPNLLITNLNQAIDGCINRGRKPILLCDIDETLVKVLMHEGNKCFLPTQFGMFLNESSILSKCFGLLALTARSIRDPKILDQTVQTLTTCSPKFYKFISRNKNFGRNPQYQSGLRVINGFLYEKGIIIMGDTQKTKYQTMQSFFIDNDQGWFPEFVNHQGHGLIRFAHAFHYNFDACEQKEFYKIPSPIPEGAPKDNEGWEVLDSAEELRKEELREEEARDEAADYRGFEIRELAGATQAPGTIIDWLRSSSLKGLLTSFKL